MRRKFLALAMATTLLTTTAIPYRFVNAAFNPESSNSLLVTTSDGNVRQSLDSGAGIESTYGDEDIVTVIVELNEDSLLENFNEGDYANTSTYDSNAVTSYLNSDNAEVTSDKLLSRQETVVNKIENLNKRTSNDVDLKYNYTTVMNGFAINVKYGMFDKIKAMPEVKTAYIAGTYALDDPAMTTSNGMIGSNGTWDLNYKGEGMVVAILDTGLDYEHEAFTNTNLSNPRLTESDIEAAKQLASPVANGSFVNAKVPFSYDYADDDSDVKPSMESVEKNGNDHGTHVAGTVAGDSSTIQGVAPQAQLLIMKVFSDVIGKKGAETEDILAGLEDAVKLGADVINMSLGSSSGYSEGEEEGVQEVYNSIVEAGINLSVSAGNSYSATYNNEAGGAYSENPDTSIVGSPSTYPASTSVASIINTGYYASYFGVNGAKLTYTETAVGSQPKLTGLVQSGTQQDYEYCMVPNLGKAEDYAGLDVAGKIAVVKRGEITFTQKVANAKAASAAAIVIYNNQPGTITMQVDSYDIPAVSVTESDGASLAADSNKVMTIFVDEGHFNSVQAYQMSDFSSWGVTPDLKLKPEITAPGENIYSALPYNNSYGSMSGTSMAAPHIAGTFALVKQYIKTNAVPSATDVGKQSSDLANQLLMSTASPQKDEDGTYYSPRKQGSGLVNVYKAVTTGAYAYVEDEEINNRPKLDLLDSEAGIFEADFVVKSVTGSAITYTLSSNTLTEDCIDGGILEKAKDISGDVVVTYSGSSVNSDTLTLNPYEEARVHVSITVGENAKNYINQNFANGEFIEGFVFLTNTDTSGVDLSLPFMGFYGDWTKAPIMDSSSVYDNNFYSSGGNEIYQQAPSLLYGEDGKTLLGVNPYDSLAYTLIGGDEDQPHGYSVYSYSKYYKQILPLDINKIAISPNGDGYYDELDTAQISLLRNARTLVSTITNSKNEKVAGNTVEFATKSSYQTSAIVPTYDTLDWAPASFTNNEVFTYTITGTLDYDKEQHNVKNSMSFPITIDIEKPVLKSISVNKKDDRMIATLKVMDNQYVAYAGIYGYTTEKGKEINGHLLSEPTKATQSEVTIDITDYVNTKALKFAVVLADYAGNEKEYICFTDGTILSGNDSENSGGSTAPGNDFPVVPGNEKTNDITITAAQGATSIEISANDVKAAIEDTKVDVVKVVITMNDTTGSVNLSAATLEALKKAGKGILIVIEDKSGNVIGTWKFDAKEIKEADKLSTFNLLAKADSLDKLKESSQLLKALLETNKASGLYIDTAANGALPVQGTLTVSMGNVSGATKGNIVYIYKVNMTTGKLETIVGGYSHTIDTNGNVDFDAVAGGEYVILTQKAPTATVTSLKNQITAVVESNTLQAGKTTKINTSLPSCLKIVSKLGDTTQSAAIGGVTVSYKTSDKSVATVSKSGKVTTKNAGTVTITATMKLYNGTKKTFSFKLKVK